MYHSFSLIHSQFKKNFLEITIIPGIRTFPNSNALKQKEDLFTYVGGKTSGQFTDSKGELQEPRF